MTSAVQTRRALLGAGLGALATTIWSALGRPGPVRAEGQQVLVGGEYTDATSQTLIQNQTNAESVIVAQAGPGGTALVGIGSNSTGVAGSSSSGTGVYANSNQGIGLDAYVSYGPAAVQATAFDASNVAIKAINPIKSGTAIKTQGLLKFGTSGIATIAANATSVTVDPGVDVTNAFVLLTPMAKLGRRSLWFTLDTVNDKFTIHMNPSRTSATKVSWLMLSLPT